MCALGSNGDDVTESGRHFHVHVKGTVAIGDLFSYLVTMQMAVTCQQKSKFICLN